MTEPNVDIKSPGAKAPQARSSARLAAVQALYQVDMTGIEPANAVKEFELYRFSEVIDDEVLAQADPAFFQRLVVGISEEADELDDMLSVVLAEGWPVERLERILRIILRAGVFELSRCLDVPARVAISEYVKLAEAFYEGKEPAMVNGVLDGLARRLRSEEFDGGSRDTVVATGT